MNMLNSIVALLLLAGGIWLQIFLSKSEKKWPGLVLPSISMLFAIIAVLGAIAFTYGGSESMLTYTDDEGNEITEIYQEPNSVEANTGEMIGTSLYIFLLYNIPTIILITIYFSVRKRQINHIDRTRIQDL